jgi:hypothetical protein
MTEIRTADWAGMRPEAKSNADVRGGLPNDADP